MRQPPPPLREPTLATGLVYRTRWARSRRMRSAARSRKTVLPQRNCRRTKAGSATYTRSTRLPDSRPATEPDGQVQQVCVKIGTAEWQDSVNNPERFSQGGYLGNSVKTVFRPDDDLPAGSVTAVFRCLDEGISSSSPEVSCVFTVLASPFESITEHETK